MALTKTPRSKATWTFVLFLSLLLDGSSANNPYCPVCGPGKIITDFNAEVFIPTYGSFTCELLESRSKEGYVPSDNCFALQMFARNDCGCEYPPPTQSPSKSPSDVPSVSLSDATTFPSQEPSSPSVLTLGFYGSICVHPSDCRSNRCTLGTCQKEITTTKTKTAGGRGGAATRRGGGIRGRKL